MGTAQPAGAAQRPSPPDPAGLLDRISDGLVVLDLEFRYTLVNKQAASLLGRPVAELLGGSYYELFPDAVGTPFERAYAAAMVDQVPAVIEAHYEPWDRWFENRIYPLGDGIAILFTEITERKRAERQLEFQAELLGSVSEAVIATGPDLGVAYWNAGAESLFGWSAEDVLGRPLDQAIPAVTADDRAEILQAVRRDGSWRGITPRRRRDGSLFEAELLVSARPLAGRGFGGLIGVAIDVSERRAAQREVEHRGMRLAALHEIERLVIAGGSVEDIARTAVRLARELSGADLVGLGLAERTTGLVTTVATDGISAILTPADRRPWPVAAEPLRSGQMMVLDDLATVAARSPSAAAMVAEGWHASLTAPMLVEGDFVGVLSLNWRMPGQATDEHQAMVSELATTVAVGIRQAQLRAAEARSRHDLEAHVRQLDLLREIDVATLNASTVEGLGAGVLAAVRRASEADRAVLSIYESPAQPGRPSSLRVVAMDVDGPTALGVGFRASSDPDLDARLMGGEILSIGDLAAMADGDPTAALANEGLGAIQIVPLGREGTLTGTLTLGWEHPRRFESADNMTLLEIARVTALALEKTRLHEQTDRRARSLAAVHAVAADLQSVRPTAELAATAMNVLKRLVGFEYGAILLLDATTGALLPLAVHDHGGPLAPVVDADAGLGIGRGITGWVAAHAESLRVGDVTADPRYVAGRHDIRSEVCVPIVDGGRVIGVVNVEAREFDAYTEDDQLVLETVASQLGIALANARLLDDLVRHADELEGRVEQRTAELTEINAELDAFSYSVSHDLRAPLRAMHGFADALIEDEADRLSATGRGYAARILSAAGRMEVLIDDLLAYGRLSRAHLELTDVSLGDAVADALRQHEATIRTTHATIRVAKRLGSVRGHPQTLVQVIANLVGNALKYVPTGSAPEVSIRAEATARGRRVWVEDNGIGVAPEHRERIFLPFERLHGVEAFAGTGIGLAVVRRGLERMGGSCGVESEPGHGSRFWIELARGGGREH